MQFRTRAIHVGQEHDPATGAVVPPIHLASTFVQPDASMTAAYDYARTGSPTRHAFEKTLADLDGGVRALAFASAFSFASSATANSGIASSGTLSTPEVIRWTTSDIGTGEAN